MDVLILGDTPQWLTLRSIENDEDAFRILLQLELKPQDAIAEGPSARKNSVPAYNLLG